MPGMNCVRQSLGSSYQAMASFNSTSAGLNHSVLKIVAYLLYLQQTLTQPKAFDFPYQHFALIYISQEGELGVESSPSIKSPEETMFTPKIRERFSQIAGTDGPRPATNLAS
jgi:hypothetical protein